MKHMKTVEVQATTKQVEDYRSCDLCKKPMPFVGLYDAEEVTITHRQGSSYPEGGSGTTLDLDVCTPCFADKVLPWLRSQGVTANYEEWDW